ncbi:MAG: dihydropteroate synthase [Gammaproteobacteria bacterium]|nr:dihydropteroate synthase [Gammaproteobacteria bacterium]
MLKKTNTKIIGILNITKNSFFDGGKYLNINNATKHVKNMIENDVDIIDIGAESSKPGFSDIDANIQLKRIIPVLKKLKKIKGKFKLSIDTRSSLVASESIKQGVSIINDVSAGTYDSDMFKAIAQTGTELIITHMPEIHKQKKIMKSKNILKDVEQYLTQRINDAVKCGIKRRNIIVDPGICYGKKGDDNIKILQNLSFFVKKFKRVCIGASNKEFSTSLFKNYKKKDIYISSIVTTTQASLASVEFIRVHDVCIASEALKICNKVHNS